MPNFFDEFSLKTLTSVRKIWYYNKDICKENLPKWEKEKHKGDKNKEKKKCEIK